MLSHKEIQEHYETLLKKTEKLLFHSGVEGIAKRGFLVRAMAVKIFSNAATIGYLHQGTKLIYAPKTFFYDIDSAAVLARTMLEGYSLFYYTFLEKVSPEESVLRVYRYRVNDIEISNTIHRLNGNLEGVEIGEREIVRLKDEIIALLGEAYDEAAEKQEKQNARKKKARTIEIYEKLGYTKETIDLFYTVTSGSVHSDLSSLYSIAPLGDETIKEKSDKKFYLYKAIAIAVLELMLQELSEEFGVDILL